MKSLAKQSLDTLVDSLLDELEAHVRVIAPGAKIGVLDSYYVGNLKQMLLEKHPGVPDSVFHLLRDDLIVVQQDYSAPTRALTRFDPSRLRVPKTKIKPADGTLLQETYGPLTNVNVVRHKYLDPDLFGIALRFSPHFFSPKSIDRWAQVTLSLARQTAALAELKSRVGLSQKEVINEDTEHTLVRAYHDD